jgi:hypothetical protein
MKFLATFDHWCDVDCCEKENDILESLTFIVEADSLEDARSQAKKYEGLETHSQEGLGQLKNIEPITDSIACHFPLLSIYEEYRRQQTNG